MQPTWRDNLRIVHLLWAPWKLPEVARSCSFRVAGLCGYLAACVQFGALVGVLVAAIDGPYFRVREYLEGVPRSIIFGILLFIPILAPFGLHSQMQLRFTKRYHLAVRSSFYLLPVVTLLPLLLWSTFWIASSVSEVVVSPVSNWTTSLLVRLPASRFVPMLVLIAAAVLGRMSFTRLRIHFAENPSHCKRCGYDLTGLPHGRCPECGHQQASANPSNE